MKKVKKEILDIGFANHDKMVKSEWCSAIGTLLGIGLGLIALKHTVWAEPMDDTANEANKNI